MSHPRWATSPIVYRTWYVDSLLHCFQRCGVLLLLLTSRAAPLLACAQGNLEECVSLLRQAGEIAKKALGEEHPEFAHRLSNLAGVLLRQGHAEEAARTGKQALAIFEKALGPDHPTTQSVRRAWG